MSHGIERRRCIRFVIPGMEVKYKKKGLFVFSRIFSEPFPAIDISKGGVAFACDEKLSKGKKLVVQLLIPGDNLLNLNAIVRRQEQTVGSKMMVTGVEFMPFGEGHGFNKIETLDLLRKLEEKYKEMNR
jgi:hypothetical protein